MTKFRIFLAVILAALIAGVYLSGLNQYLTLDFYREQQGVVQAFVQQNRALAALLFYLVYITATALSLPVAALFALLSGALFGMVMGTIVISLASTTGAVLAFLVSRFLLQDFVDQKFPQAAKMINQGIQRDGAAYLFCIRLVPAMPYFVLNLVMGLTHMPVRTFAWVTQVGLLPITLVLTNAGEQIALIDSPADIMSPGLIASLTLIGLFPLVAKKVLERLQTRA